MKLAATALAALFAASGVARTAETASTPTAKGTFKRKDVSFEVASAVAWNGSSFFEKKNPALKAVKVTKGFEMADRATLVIDGESTAGKVTGEVLLVQKNGAWGVDEELVDLKFD